MRRLLLPVLVGLTLLAAASPAAAKDIHVDCDAPVAGDGTAAAPFNSIAQPFDLRPDHHLLFRRGSTCEGTLRVTSGDNGAQPASVGAYGSGDLPKIVGAGQDAVRLSDVSNLTVSDLDISNPGPGGPLGEGDQVRNGIRVTAQSESVRNLTLSGLVIHDVNGDLTKNGDGSAAIQATVTGSGSIHFQNLLVKGNRITSVSRSAISISGTNDLTRPDADQPWPAASTGVVIEDNRIDLIAGDGIVPRGTDGAIVQDNIVSRGNLAGRPLLDPEGPMCNAGIWTFRSNNTVIRGNEVFGMEHNGCDGTGFDVDYRQDGTIIEGNYSHDNEGGFVLLCSDETQHRADVRFNLSVDDGTMINHGPCGIAEGIIGDLSGIRMYNNTVVSPSPTVSLQLGLVDEMFMPGDFRFENNLVFARSETGQVPCGERCSHNAFFNLPPSGDLALFGDPLLTGPLLAADGKAAASGFRLKSASPLRGAGIPVTGGGAKDFFGNPIPKVPSIGFDQTPLAGPPTGPNKACKRARTARTKARNQVAGLARQLRKLRRSGAAPKRIRPVVRRLGRARSEVKRQHRKALRTCPGGATRS
ncbi:MAG: Right-handed parallel beta-helix repeat-containing protein [Actinomycetota bacterium]|nr:Right-handed parallel beta-helix repeat-containing protein [Actinomycetota bacterium]